MTSPYKQPYAALFETFENRFLDFTNTCYQESDHLGRICNYALLGPGKRARAMFCLLAQQALGLRDDELRMIPAIALEMVHCYSLIHDDLPCMDDDDLRRGRPTAHVKFDEAGALLAGDTLLTDAFGLLSGSLGGTEETIDDGIRLQWIRELALASGTDGMVSGQMLDLFWTGRQGATKADLDGIHLRKTGYLMGAACSMGAATAGADAETIARYRNFGRNIGLAFQVIDDMLDVQEGTGKSVGKDRDTGKLTYLNTTSIEDCRQAARAYTHDAIAQVKLELPHSKNIMDFSAQLLDRAF